MELARIGAVIVLVIVLVVMEAHVFNTLAAIIAKLLG